MFSAANILGSILFGAIGLGGVQYGRNAGLLNPILFGVALMAFPYVVTQTWLLYGIGVLLTALMWRYRES